MTLYSLEPEGGASEGAEDFYGYNVKGKTEVKSESSRILLKRSLINSMAFSAGGGAACFNPRQGLRISDEAKRSIC